MPTNKSGNWFIEITCSCRQSWCYSVATHSIKIIHEVVCCDAAHVCQISQQSINICGNEAQYAANLGHEKLW